MTITGDKIVACPRCASVYKNHIIGSYNTFGAIPYSDGHTEGILPNFISVIKCHNTTCNFFFQLNDAKVLGEILKDDTKESFPDNWVTATTLYNYRIERAELEEALETEFSSNRSNEILVRTLLLRRFNDAFREDRTWQLSENDKIKFENNLDRLIELNKTEKSDTAQLFLAELYRERGDFASCIELLKKIKNKAGSANKVKEKIYSQAKVKDAVVFNLYHAVVKIEYQCNSCNESVILFDLAKLDTKMDYQYFRCQTENIIFSAPFQMENPEEFYELTFWQKLFTSKKSYEALISCKDVICTQCNTSNVNQFNPKKDSCIQCKSGNYQPIKWFD